MVVIVAATIAVGTFHKTRTAISHRPHPLGFLEVELRTTPVPFRLYLPIAYTIFLRLQAVRRLPEPNGCERRESRRVRRLFADRLATWQVVRRLFSLAALTRPFAAATDACDTGLRLLARETRIL